MEKDKEMNYPFSLDADQAAIVIGKDNQPKMLIPAYESYDFKGEHHNVWMILVYMKVLADPEVQPLVNKWAGELGTMLDSYTDNEEEDTEEKDNE